MSRRCQAYLALSIASLLFIVGFWMALAREPMLVAAQTGATTVPALTQGALATTPTAITPTPATQEARVTAIEFKDIHKLIAGEDRLSVSLEDCQVMAMTYHITDY